ncbi:hypothetical protein ACIA5D_17870 [Actinoplanes sp. NPDC051513]|uniref:hypothetical protein n=1 Tax=Actinoplanes sp. NPDC051513 TaxID=3363908 RepID=UPI0037A34ECD
MMPAAFTPAEVSSLIADLIARMGRSGAIEDGAYTLDEVSGRTGFALSSLIKDCRAGRLEHVHYGDARSMTPTQVGKLLKQFSEGGDLVRRRLQGLGIAEPDEMTQARHASQRAASRPSRRRTAA